MSYDSLNKFQVITAGDMSQATITSSIVNIELADNVGIEFTWTGSPTGTFSVEVSIDHAQDQLGNVTVAGNWTALTFSSTPDTTSQPVYLDMNQLSAPWIRCKYTKTSGSGTLSAWIAYKRL